MAMKVMRCDCPCRGRRGVGGRGVPHGPAHSRGAPSCRDRCCSKHFIFGSLKRLRGEPFAFYKLCLLAGLTDAGNVSVADEKQFPGSSAPPVFGGGDEEQMGVGSQTRVCVPIEAPRIRAALSTGLWGPWTSPGSPSAPPVGCSEGGRGFIGSESLGSSLDLVWLRCHRL